MVRLDSRGLAFNVFGGMEPHRKAYSPVSREASARAHNRLGYRPFSRHDPDRYRVRESDASDDRLRGAIGSMRCPFRLGGAHPQRRRGFNSTESNKENRHR